jgi:hypothetical protein
MIGIKRSAANVWQWAACMPAVSAIVGGCHDFRVWLAYAGDINIAGVR